MRVCFISVPYDLGRYNVGQGLGPRVLLSTGLDRMLSEAGHLVNNRTLVLEGADDLTDTQVTFQLNRLLSEAVSETRADGCLPVVLAANCITSTGTLSGLGNPDTNVIWLDAHADFNTPETTESGYLDGMALATACGRCWKALTARDPRFVPVKEENVTLVGTRDIDPEESKVLAASRVRILNPEDLRKHNHQFPSEWGLIRGEAYIHFDADILDNSIGRANVFAAPGGLLEDEVDKLLSWAASSYEVAALAVTAYNPRYDDKGSVRETLKRIIRSVVNAAAESASGSRVRPQ
ncbi:MAG TPA: arginase family protein [Spirochaetia bacterium]